MSSKTSTGIQFNARTMNGIIDINADNITADSINSTIITADNLLEADQNETITGEWLFTQLPYVLDAPTDPNQVVNKNYVDVNFETIADVSANFLRITDASNIYLSQTDASNIYLSQIDASNIYLSQTDASNIYLSITNANANFMDLSTDQAVFGEKVFVDSMANTTIWYSNNIVMFPTYEPTQDYSVATKIYVDSLPTGITEASGNALYVSLFANQGVSGVKTFNNIFMTGVYTPTSAQQVATKAYVDSLVVGSSLPFGAIFGKGVDTNGNPMPTFTNCRLQDPADSPTSLEVGQSNVIIGRRAGQFISGPFSRFNTFVGAESGGQFQKGITNPFGLGNVFIGTHAGDNSQSTEGNANQGYQYNYTVSIGAYSFPSESNSTNLGGIFVRIHGYLKCPLYEAINTPSLNINTSGNGISLSGNQRIFFDNLVGTSNHYTANSHFFTGTLYQFIGGLNYEILSANNAWTKSVSDTRFVRTGAVNQTIEGIKTFTQFTYYKPGFVSYKLLSELEAYTKTEIDANFLTITDASNTYFTIANATGFLTNSNFFNGSNTRIQDPNDSPSAFNGFNNTFVGYRSGQHAGNSSLSGLNTFIGFQAGKFFGDGGLQGGTSNTFIGSNSGFDPNGPNGSQPYAFTGTVCIGPFSVATADNQIVLGNSANNVIVPGNIRAGSLDISGNGNGIFSNNNVRIFFDVVTGSSNHYEATSHFFTGTLYQFIGGLNYEILSANNAWTKSVADNRFLRIGASGDPPVAQTVLGTKTFANILMSSGYVPSVDLAVLNKGFADSTYATIADVSNNFLTILDASNQYLPIVDASGFASTAEFFNGSNTRLQDPNDSPSAFNGFNNTFVGYRSGQHAGNSSLSGLNSFIGFQAGKFFGDGGLQGGTSNTFIGSNSGFDPNGPNGSQPYAFTGTTCIGPFSVATADDQIVLGNSSNDIIIKGALLNQGISTFTGTVNFLSDSFQIISGVSRKLINTLDADAYQLKSNIRNSFDVNQATYYSTTYSNNQFQTLANLVTFFISANTATRYYSASYSNATYQLLSNIRNSATNTTTTYFSTSFINSTFQTIANMANYLTTSVASATYQTIADMSNYVTTAFATANYQRLPKQFTQWRYGVQTFSSSTFLSWSSGQFLWTASAGSTAGYTNFKHQTGFNAVGEGTGQLSNATGFWTAVSEGMYDIQINIQSYPTFNNYILVSFNDSTGFMGNDIMMKTGLTQNATGATPLAVSNTFHAQVYLKANEGFRIRTVANGFIYSFYNNTYQIITKLTGY